MDLLTDNRLLSESISLILPTASRIALAVRCRLPKSVHMTSLVATAVSNGITISCLFFVIWITVRATRAISAGTERTFVSFAPGFLTSVGIFGTFLGIVVGLLGFDPQNIDTSIGQLLEGLKTAFLTSIFGMAGAMWIKWRDTRHASLVEGAPQEADTGEIGPEQIHAVLIRQAGHTEALLKSLGGDHERSLIGQLQLLRTENNDYRSANTTLQKEFQTQLFQRLTTFSEMLSRSATEQVIEALKQVIVEFNTRLTEQFGDNFKRLDESVKKLVEWQQEYRQQMEEMGRQYALGVQAITSTQSSVEAIRQETARIPADMQQLATVLSVNQHQIGELDRHLEAFVAMRHQAVIAVPQIQQHLEQVGQQLHTGAEKVNSVLLQGSEQFQHSVQLTNSSMIEAAKNVATQSEIISKELSDAFTLLQLNTERIRTGITATISEAMSSVEEGAKTAAQTTNQHVHAVASSMEATMRATLDRVGAVHKDVSKSLESITQGVSSAAGQMLVSVEESSKTAALATAKHAQGAASGMEASLRATLERLNTVQAEIERSFDTVSKSVAESAQRSLGGVERQVQDAVSRTNEAVNLQLRNLDEALERQLRAALQELGSALGTIAAHLADSYQRRSREPMAHAE